jgi:hypothetical protein
MNKEFISVNFEDLNMMTPKQQKELNTRQCKLCKATITSNTI